MALPERSLVLSMVRKVASTIRKGAAFRAWPRLLAGACVLLGGATNAFADKRLDYSAVPPRVSVYTDRAAFEQTLQALDGSLDAEWYVDNGPWLVSSLATELPPPADFFGAIGPPPRYRIIVLQLAAWKALLLEAPERGMIAGVEYDFRVAGWYRWSTEAIAVMIRAQPLGGGEDQPSSDDLWALDLRSGALAHLGRLAPSDPEDSTLEGFTQFLFAASACGYTLECDDCERFAWPRETVVLRRGGARIEVNWPSLVTSGIVDFVAVPPDDCQMV